MHLPVPFLLFVSIYSCSALAQNNFPTTADQIMNQVAVNQDRAEASRRQYVYKQHIHVVSRKTNGKLMREEAADYDVFPAEQVSSKKLTHLTGKYWHEHEYLSYSGEPAPNADSLDGDLITDLRDDLANERKSRDGLAVDLFPLTSKEQQNYEFRLIGEEVMNGRGVYRINFSPKKTSDRVWRGEALIDKQDLEPVNVYTKLSRKVPLLIRTALGTDVPGVGFSVTYKRQADGTWFPASFGTEFRLRALFFINRDITISLDNSDFEKTHVDSIIRP